MALETIQQILAPSNAPYINGVAARLKFAPAVLENVYQGLVEKNDKGVNDNWVSSADANDDAQVIVHRILPVEMNPREQGANKNGASYSQNQHYVQTESVKIDILTTLDDPILIPRARQDMIAVDLLAKEVKIFSDRLSTIVNGGTAAAKILATYVEKSKGKEVNEVKITASDISNKKVLDRYIEGNSLLDEGDIDHGIDIFPTDTRIAVFRVSYRATLKAGGILTLGGANEAYAILAGSGVNNQGEARTAEDGFVGVIDGVECRLISNESLGHAARFLGFPKNEFKKGSPFCGYISSSYANARGVSVKEQTKVVDEVNGQGIRLLPYVKMGFVSWYPLGNVFFTSEDYNPFGDLKTVLNFTSDDVAFKLKAYGSRLVPVLASLSITAGTGFTYGAITANDDWNTNHIEKAAYVVTDDKLTTVAEFLKAYKTDVTASGTVHGALSTLSGATISQAGLTANKYLNILAIADDGTCELFSQVAPAS